MEATTAEDRILTEAIQACDSIYTSVPLWKQERTEWLLKLARALDESWRYGADQDVPEGVRYIQISDTLAKQIAQKLREIAGYVHP